VAELVDAADSKSAVRKDVLVRFQSRALTQVEGNPFQDCLFILDKTGYYNISTIFNARTTNDFLTYKPKLYLKA
jgi:hypothetical protein